MPVSATSRRMPPQRPPATVDKRDAILKAATQIFARRGFFNAQVADVARNHADLHLGAGRRARATDGADERGLVRDRVGHDDVLGRGRSGVADRQGVRQVGTRRHRIGTVVLGERQVGLAAGEIVLRALLECRGLGRLALHTESGREGRKGQGRASC